MTSVVHLVFKGAIHFGICIILTVTTQVGGLLYLFPILIVPRTSPNRRLKQICIFMVCYSLVTFLMLPYIAPIFGREKIKESEYLQAKSFFYKLTNRNYVKPELNQILEKVASDFGRQNGNIKIIYLDANFPFIDKFPLLPHLSHNDGRKIDISFVYETSDGKMTNMKRSFSGYGVFENARSYEINQTETCLRKGYWLYDFSKYLTFGKINDEIKLSESGTRELIKLILAHNEIGKLFIEPHLKSRLKLSNSKIRFHGCRAVRHDDHIHFQVK